MRVTSLFALFLLGIAWPAHGDEFDAEPKQADEKNSEGRKFDRDAWLRRHKNGPIYRVEVLYRREPEGRLFYLRTLISPASPQTREFPGLGLDERGDPVPPPDPGRARITAHTKEAVSRGGEQPPPPLAETTVHLGVSIRPPDAGGKTAQIHVSDLGAGMPLPAKSGEVSVACFSGAIFRLERLDALQLKKEEPLRQSPAAFRERTAALGREFLGAHRTEFIRDEYQLCTAAHVLLDPGLVGELRKKLSTWIERTPDDVDGKGVPTHIFDSLSHCGEASDFALFRRLCQRHPKHAPYVGRAVITLIVRVGANADARQVMRSLLEDHRAVSSVNDRVALVRKLDGTIPEPSQGDELMLSLARELNVKPSTFRFRSVQARLLEFAGREVFAAEDLRNWKECVEKGWGDWVMMTEADRQRGIDAAIEILRTR